jgi:predicted ABC-type exoprotein transport system permease subunit
MNIDKKSIISSACGFVLAMGLVVILVITTMPLVSHFSLGIQRSYSLFIFFFSLLVVVPLVSRRLNRLPDIKKILGWTFIGLGAEFFIFPVTILFLVLSSRSIGFLLLGGMTFALSVVFGIPASLISFIMGISLVKSKR